MVAPHDTGELLRSLVCIPGSGRDKTLSSKCCDLRRVSSFAATVPIDTTLPQALAQPQAPVERSPDPEVSKGESNMREVQVMVSSQRGSRRDIIQQQFSQIQSIRNEPRYSTLSHREPNHELTMQIRARNVFITPSTSGLRVSPAKSFILQPQGGVHRHPQQMAQQNGLFLLQSNSETGCKLSQAVKELQDLRAKNASLQKRISLFQQLFRDKKRLASVVKRLGVKVE